MSSTESEEVLTWAEIAAATTLRAVELAAIAVATIFVAPPLVILAVIVIVPAIALVAVAGLIALPVLAVRHVHRYRGAHPHRFVRRLAKRPA
jgi:hypothetical protein